MGNLDEYLFPEVYDAEYGKFGQEGEFFLKLSSSAKIGILDLACGTGRLTIPIAKSREVPVFGVDLSQPMLSLAAQKSRDLNIQWICHDVVTFCPSRTVDFVLMGGNAFQALLMEEQQRQFFKNLSYYLLSQGYFVFGVRNPATYQFTSEKSDFEYWHDFIDHNGLSVQVWGQERYDSDTQIGEFITQRRWTDHQTETWIQLRFSRFKDVMALIDQAKFEVVFIYGDYDGSAFIEDLSPSMIFVLKKV